MTAAIGLVEYIRQDELNLPMLDNKTILQQLCLHVESFHTKGQTILHLIPESIILQWAKQHVNVHLQDVKLYDGVIEEHEIKHSNTAYCKFYSMPDEHPCQSANIFSLGCIFYFVLTKGQHPFGSNEYSIIQNLKQGNYCLQAISDFWPAFDLVQQMICYNSSKRPDINLILRHSYFILDNTLLRMKFLNNVSNHRLSDNLQLLNKLNLDFQEWFSVQDITFQHFVGIQCLDTFHQELKLFKDFLSNVLSALNGYIPESSYSHFLCGYDSLWMKLIDDCQNSSYLKLLIHFVWCAVRDVGFTDDEKFKFYQNIPDKSCFSLLHLAVRYGSLEDVEISFNHLKNSVNEPLELMDINGRVPLHHASECSSLESVEYLLEKGAKLEPVSVQMERTPLHYAAAFSSVKVVELLLNTGANLEARDKGQCTPLHYAAETKSKETVLLLLQRGASANSRAACNSTPLHYACSEASTDAVEILLACEIDVEARDDSGRTALHYAVQTSSIEMVEMLLNRGFDLESKDCDLRTPFRLAVRCSSKEMIEYLLSRNARVDTKDYLESTPLHEAAARSCKEIVEILLSRKVNLSLNDKDMYGNTPLSWAKSEVIRQLLISHGVQ